VQKDRRSEIIVPFDINPGEDNCSEQCDGKDSDKRQRVAALVEMYEGKEKSAEQNGRYKTEFCVAIELFEKKRAKIKFFKKRGGNDIDQKVSSVNFGSREERPASPMNMGTCREVKKRKL
jgi:hypothetical protein